MSNVHGDLVCGDGQGTVTAQVSGTGTSGGNVFVSLNGQGRTQISKQGDPAGNWAGTLRGTFADGETVYLLVERADGTKQIKVLKVDCPHVATTTAAPTTTTTTLPPTTAPPTSEPAQVTGQTATTSQPTQPPATGPELPAVGFDAGIVVAAALALVAAGAALASIASRFFNGKELS